MCGRYCMLIVGMYVIVMLLCWFRLVLWILVSVLDSLFSSWWVCGRKCWLILVSVVWCVVCLMSVMLRYDLSLCSCCVIVVCVMCSVLVVCLKLLLLVIVMKVWILSVLIFIRILN